jgi:hypothetical protein
MPPPPVCCPGFRFDSLSRASSAASLFALPIAWYSGPFRQEKQQHGLAIVVRSRWHTRSYGLLAANIFGLRDFENDKSKDGSLNASGIAW